MFRRLNLRLAFLGLLLLAGAAWVLSKEHRPSVLRPGVRMHAYITNTADGTVSVVDLVRLSSIATIAVGPAPSGVRAHPTRDEIWGVSTDGGYVWVIDARSSQIKSRIPVGAAPPAVSHAEPFALDFSPDGKRAFVAASGSNTLTAIDCASQEIIGTARTGKRPWLARVTPDGKLVLVPNRDDSTVSVLDAATLATIATVPVAAHPESIEVLLDSKKAFVSAAGSGCHPERSEGSACGQVSVLDLQKPALLTNLSLGSPATDLVLKSDGGELYVPAPATHGLAILNTWTNEVTEQVLVGDAPSRGILTADANILYVTDAAAGRVLPIEITFRHVLPPIAVGRRPGVARFSPGEDLLLVVNEDSDDLAVIRVRTQSLLTLIPVGHRPRDIAVKVF